MSDDDRPGLLDRVAGFRDEVLGGADGGDRAAPGSEVFDAVLRALAGGRGAGRAAWRDSGSRRGGSRWVAGVDLALHDAIARRLAWRDSELGVLGDTREVCRRFLAVGHRLLSEPEEEMDVAQAVAESGSAASRILIILVLGRVARERAALLREELAQERLSQALERQRHELDRLEKALAEARRSP